MAIHFYRKDVPEKKLLAGDNCISISFRPQDTLDSEQVKPDFYLEMIDYTTSTNAYPKGSMGHMNGLNNPGIPLRRSITVSRIIGLMVAQKLKG